MPVKVNKDMCIGCGACAGVCPVGSITLDENEGKACPNPETCIDCAACVGTCPVGAIESDN